MDYVIEIRNIKKCYQQGEDQVTAVDIPELKFRRGKITAIVGRSGSGKSTLLNILGGMDKPTAGDVFVDGVNLFQNKNLTQFRTQKIGFVFQDYNLIPELTVTENIRLPLLLTNRTIDGAYEKDIVDMLELQERLSFYPKQLSGGQKQRAAIARALITKPSVILADEPTGSIDLKSSHQLIQYIKQSHEQLNQTFIIVTHDPEVSKCADEIITLEDGKIR